MSRAEAFRTVSLDDYAQSMQGIYTESVSEETKDEAPIVYKPKEEIIANIHDTVTVVTSSSQFTTSRRRNKQSNTTWTNRRY